MISYDLTYSIWGTERHKRVSVSKITYWQQKMPWNFLNQIKLWYKTTD
jgi:hypothetical protein